MNYMLTRIVNFFFVIIGMCSHSKMYSQLKERAPYIIYVDEITSAFIGKIEKEHNLVCTGSGGSMPYDVEKIIVNFHAYNSFSIEKARALFIEVTEQLVNMVNVHEKIRPFLREYPFTSERAQIMISFTNETSAPYIVEGLELMYQARGKLFYCTNDPETDQYVDLLKESYEEAKQKVLPSIQEL